MNAMSIFLLNFFLEYYYYFEHVEDPAKLVSVIIYFYLVEILKTL